jgi:polyisoprenoid-binding protein YceI
MESKKTNWAIDRNHSEVQFKVKHLAISNVSGTIFLEYNLAIFPN